MPTALDEARHWIALAETPLQKLLAMSGIHRAHLDAMQDPWLNMSSQAWSKAGAEVRDFLLQEIELNPGKSLADLIARPDVQQALTVPFFEASQTTKLGIGGAWNVGQDLGNQHAAEMLEVLDKQPVPIVDTDGLLQNLKDDADMNSITAAEKYVGAISNDPIETKEQMDKITKDYARRARLGAQTSAQRSHAERIEAELKAAGVKHKIWITSFSPTTCGDCAALHGKVVTTGATFSTKAHLGPGKAKPAYGKLLGPPRHPNCRCRLAPYVEGTSKSGPTPFSMAEFAIEFIKKLLGG